MAYVDRTYYEDEYKGFVVPSNAFGFYAERASEEIDRYVTGEIDAQDPINEVKKATCSVVDILYKIDNPGSDKSKITSETVGSYKLSFKSSVGNEKSNSSAIYNAIEKYLSKTGLLYRGVNHVY